MSYLVVAVTLWWCSLVALVVLAYVLAMVNADEQQQIEEIYERLTR